MQAAFVDISLDKNAFLFAGDICDGQDIKKLVKKGVLPQEQYNVAVNASNLNDMVQKTEEDVKAVQAQQKASTSNNADKKIVELTYPDSWEIKDGSKPYEIKQLL